RTPSRTWSASRTWATARRSAWRSSWSSRSSSRGTSSCSRSRTPEVRMGTPISRRIAFCLLVLAILVVTVFPFAWAFLSSVRPVGYWPARPTLESYRRVLANGDFQEALLNSAIVSLSVTGLSLAVGSLAAYSLGRFRFRGRSLVLYVILMMTMFPQIAVLGAL